MSKPPTRWRVVRRAEFLVPFAILWALAVFANSRGALIGLAALVVLTAARLNGRVDLAAENALRRLLIVPTVVFSSVLFLVVLLPAWALNRISGIDPMSQSHGFGGWAPASDTEGHDPTRTYIASVTPKPPLARRLVRVVGASALVAALVAASLTLVRPRPWGDIAGLPVSESSFPAEPWGATVLAEQFPANYINVTSPKYGWTLDDDHSRYVNIVDGRRRTLAVAHPQRTIWLFGGSTVFGVGQRDDGTIASQLVRQAEARGIRIRVVNYGVIAWVNWQETELFIDQLRTEPRPDLAIFLDGINDWYAAVERETYGLLDPTSVVFRSITPAQRAGRAASARRRGYTFRYDLRTIEQLAAAQYRSGVLRAEAAAQAAHVPMVTLWQPELTTTPVNQPTVRAVFRNANMMIGDARTEAAAYRRVIRLSGVQPVDLTHIFDHADRPIFFDSAHTNEAGASIEAAAILDRVWPELSAAR